MNKVRIRRITVLFGVVLTCVGLIAHTGTGTLSSFGWESLAYICPLGSLEVFLASKTLVPRVLVAFVVVAIVAFLLGRVFCGWICPIPPVKRFLDNLFRFRHPRKEAQFHVQPCAESSDGSHVESRIRFRVGLRTHADSHDDASANDSTASLVSRYIILVATLAASFVFGFPVFCLVCPIGLLLGLVVGVWFMLTDATVNITLLFVPIVLILELTVLRSWCSRFCPMGALMSLLSVPNRLFRPRVDASKCLQARGKSCYACRKACDEHLDPHVPDYMHLCTKCGVCQSVCPEGAISFPLLPKSAEETVDIETKSDVPEACKRGLRG